MVDHLSREELLRYIDNELSKRGARKAAEHLCKCAGCAFELDRLKQDLAAITQAEIEILERLLPAPPEPWPSLEWKLDAAATTSKNSRPRLFKPFTAIWKFPLAYGSAGLALLLCFLLIWGPLQPLSAKEVIERATAADTARLTITPQQVVRQRVRVTEKARLGSGEHTARMESWKSVRSAYWQTGSDSPNTNLHRHYEQNGLASDLPLSPPALGSWVKLAGSEPRASRNQGTIQIQVASNAEGRARGLDEFSFRVQARDWHVDEMTLSFEDAVFQIEEEDSSIFDRREVPADVLAKLEPQPKSAFPPSTQRNRPGMSGPP